MHYNTICRGVIANVSQIILRFWHATFNTLKRLDSELFIKGPFTYALN